MKKIKIGALISGSGTNLQAIIDSCENGNIDGEMAFVGSDNPEAFGLERAKKHDIENFFIDYPGILKEFKTDPDPSRLPKDYDYKDVLSKQSLFPDADDPKKVRSFFLSRGAAEGALLNKICRYDFDLLVLAGFMRILTPYFIDKININKKFRIMNIHPALLPAFPGTDGYGDTLRYGCKIGGCTVHFVDYGEDSGPIIGQKAYTIEDDDTIESIKKKGLKLEWELYPECIQRFAKKEIKISSS